jgi:pyruvate dehydrogenase E1 component alpha subunit
MAKSGSKRKPSAAKVQSVKGEQLLAHYHDMLLIRRFEERAGQIYGMGLIGGFCHLYIGQEAVVVGMQAAINNDDAVITSYRDHGHMLACGMEPRGVMAELMGRADGYSKGKGGSMHMFSSEKNFFGGHGIVGAQVPIGTGIGFALKYMGTERLCVTYLGDGAVNQGQVAEAFNMAGLWRLPVIYVIENNRYGMGTSIDRASAMTDLSQRGVGYGIQGEQVDGMDVLAVKKAGSAAAAHCRAGKGPYILEMMTYRYRGHSMSDPAGYRSREEVNQVRDEQDPIDNVRDAILKAKVASEDDFKRAEAEIRAVVADSVEFAQASPEPDASELWTDVLEDA